MDHPLPEAPRAVECWRVITLRLSISLARDVLRSRLPRSLVRSGRGSLPWGSNLVIETSLPLPIVSGHRVSGKRRRSQGDPRHHRPEGPNRDIRPWTFPA